MAIMDWFRSVWKVFFSLEETVLLLLLEHPFWVPTILLTIILLESSVFPFLPGDTALFTAGVALRTSPLSVHIGAVLFLLATVLGVTINYWIGWRLRKRIQSRGLWGIRAVQLRRTERLVDRHGARLVVLGRFLPGVRVVVSLLAGSGRMPFGLFTLYNFLGGVPWVGLFVYSGYFLGALPGIHAYLVPFIVLLSLIAFLPVLIGWIRRAWHRAHPADVPRPDQSDVVES